MFVKIKVRVWNAVKRSNVREGYDNERNVNQILYLFLLSVHIHRARSTKKKQLRKEKW